MILLHLFWFRALKFPVHSALFFILSSGSVAVLARTCRRNEIKLFLNLLRTHKISVVRKYAILALLSVATHFRLQSSVRFFQICSGRFWARSSLCDMVSAATRTRTWYSWWSRLKWQENLLENWQALQKWQACLCTLPGIASAPTIWLAPQVRLSLVHWFWFNDFSWNSSVSKSPYRD